MSPLLAILVLTISAAQIGAGLGVGLYFRRGQAEPDPPPNKQRKTTTATDPAAVEERAAQREIVEGLQQVTESIEDFVGQHAQKVEDIQQQLLATADAADGRAELERLVAELLEANMQLKGDLGDAQARIEQQKVEIVSRTQEARTDALTGLANRREFDEQLARRISEWWRRKTAVSLLVIDVDHFKRFNDSYGHQAGDHVLAGIAEVLTDTLRDMDIVARYGGEEFVAILPSTVLHEARRAAQRVIDAVNRTTFYFQGVALNVTASIGVATAQEGEDGPSLVKRGDEGVYAAKAAGRNCGYFHDGAKLVPLAGGPAADAPPAQADPNDERRNAPRRTFKVRQKVAPYYGGEVPDAEDFATVDCCDISTAGFSFYCHELPPSAQIVIALGAAPRLTFMSAEVVYSMTTSGSNGGRLHRIGCRFVTRIREKDEAHWEGELVAAH